MPRPEFPEIQCSYVFFAFLVFSAFQFRSGVIMGSAVAAGGRGDRAPLTTACAPPFRFTQNMFLEHHVTVRQQAIMEKE